MQTRSLEFSNLPQLEVSVRVYFNPNLSLDFRTINEIQETLGTADFPSIDPLSAFEISPALGPQSIKASLGEIHGAQFTGGNDGVSVVLQTQMVGARWTRGVSSAAPNYPRYARLRDTLRRAIDALQRVPAAVQLTPAIINMTYVNFIRVTDPRPYLEARFNVSGVSDARTIQEYTLAWASPAGIDLRYDLRKAELANDGATIDGYRLATVGGVRLRPPDDALAELDVVHEALLAMFEQLISDRAKEEWGHASSHR